MSKYLIRITSKLGATLEKPLILNCDFAAVRHGKQLAAPGERLEVWRGDECIFMSEELGYVHVQKPAGYAAAQ
jgi:hypothetical protein